MHKFKRLCFSINCEDCVTTYPLMFDVCNRLRISTIAFNPEENIEEAIKDAMTADFSIIKLGES